MRQLHLLGNVGLAVILVVLVNEQALATTKDKIPHHTNVKSWLVQQQPTQVTITGVRLSQTPSGLDVILETTASSKLQPIAKSEGNNFIADIPNAQLRLASGNTFRQSNPLPGITEVTVTNQDSNTIRLTVAGSASVPKVELFDSDRALIFQATPTASAPPKPSPDTKQPNEADIELVVTAQKRPGCTA